MSNIKELSYIVESIGVITDEMIAFFNERTNNHINCVKDLMSKLSGYSNLSFDELVKRGDNHDKSKFGEVEREPYIWLTWAKNPAIDNKPFRFPDGIKRLVDKATRHHIITNSHHPEFYSEDFVEINPSNRDALIEPVTCKSIPKLDLIEMVCDWTAMAIELNQGNSAKPWFNKNKGVRWVFTNENIDFIINTIEELNRRYLK